MIEHLYSTPVYNGYVSDYRALNYHIDKVIDKVDFNYKKEWGATHYLSTDFMKETNILKELGLNKIEKEIDTHLRNYCNDLDFIMRDYALESWFSKFEKGNYSPMHHHRTSDISGVYYYKTNGEDGDFWSESPNPYLETTKCYEIRFGKIVRYKPQEGKILLFPGWLKHGVKTNTKDSTRISLSFNIYFKDK
jgi:uncharacterized protein (TIGR02466 family)